MRIPSVTDMMIPIMVREAKAPIVLIILEAACPLSWSLEELMSLAAGDWDDRIIFVKLWADEHPTIVASMETLQVPAILVYKNQLRVAEYGGGIPSARVLTEMLDGALKA